MRIEANKIDDIYTLLRKVFCTPTEIVVIEDTLGNEIIFNSSDMVLLQYVNEELPQILIHLKGGVSIIIRVYERWEEKDKFEILTQAIFRGDKR